MEGVPALPWAGDAGGRIILPKAVTYEQLAAGAVEFQLYNRQNNALIPTDILRVGDHIEIREKETGGDESPYTIDKYDGARSEIVLTGDGQATRIWGLMGASFNDSVHSVRTFSLNREFGQNNYKFVAVEIDGKIYLPGVASGPDILPVVEVDGHFETYHDASYIDGGSIFPLITVVLENDPNLGEGSIMKIPTFDNITTEARNCIEIFYKEEYDNDEPWKYGQDGIFYIAQYWAMRVNGIWHAIAKDGKAVIIGPALQMGMGTGGSDIYKNPSAGIVCDCELSINVETYKENVEAEYGITFAEDILVTEMVDGDNFQPFVI